MMEEYKSDLLKYFIQYNNTNSEAMLEVSQDKCSSKFMEQLKSLINLLLHFRYMLTFAEKHGLTDYKLKPVTGLFAADFEFCSQQYSQLINSNIFFDFIRKREQFYSDNMDSYYSFKRDLTEPYGGAAHHHHGTMSHTTMVDDIVTVPDLHLVDPGGHQHGHQHSASHSAANSQDYDNGQLGQLQPHGSHHPGSAQFDHHSLAALQLSSNQTVFDDQTNKDLYANLLDLLPRSAAGSCGQPHTSAFDPASVFASGAASSSNSSATGNSVAASKPVQQGKHRAHKRPAKSPGRPTAEQAPSHQVSYAAKTGDSWKMMDYQTPELLQVEYWCSYEGCRFRSKSLLQVKAHEERRHVQQIQKCTYDGCGETFTSKDDLESHVSRTHLSAKVKCCIVQCEKEFDNEHRLKLHIKEEHQEVYLTCEFCAKKFKTRRYLSKHINRMHSTRKRLRKKRSETTSEKKEEETEDETEGEEEEEAEEDPDVEESTGEAEEEEEAEEEGQVEEARSKEIPVEPPAGPTFECTLDGCNKRFGKKSQLKQHIREEHTEDYLTCKFCDKLCRNRNNLTNHIWIMHEEGEFKCSYENCDFISKYRKNLLNHKKLRHQRMRKCQIEGCGQMVPITRYQRHMSSLHKIKNYGCSWPDCGKSFADHNALKNHVRIHLNFKRFKCKWPECGYASEQRFTVITHIRVCHFKLPRTKKKQMELNISQDSLQNPYDYLEVCREDICI